MMADQTRQLTNERRARLLAERKLDTRQADMRRDIAEMERRAAHLTNEILDKRQKLETLQAEMERQFQETQEAHARVASAEDARARSESRLWLALETVHDGFAMYDADARLNCANRAFLSIFDGLREVAPGITYDRLCEILLEEGIVDPRMPADDWLARMRDRWMQKTIPDETICLWDGQFVKLVDRRIEGGGIVALGLNQTYERRITSAIETIPDGFVIFDRDDNLVMCNQRYRDLFPGNPDLIRPGVNFQDILRQGAESGAFPDAEGRLDDWLEDRMRLHQAPQSAPIEQPVEGGRWVRIVEAETPDGGRAGLRVDVTDSKRIEAELRSAREAAEAASRAKSQFLTNMNHEFRTPLNGIIGLTSILRDRAPDDGGRRLAHAVEESAQALMGIIEDVLDTVSHETSYAVAAQEPFDLTETISHVVKLLAPKVHLRGIDLHLRYADGLPTAFAGDDGRLRQVLANLLGNACKYAPNARVTLSIDGTCTDDAPADGSVWDLSITVEDDGPGIPDGQSEHIFQRFTQAEDDNARVQDGMGLGLSLSRAVVELMGGTIKHDPDWTDGARFRISLALPQAAASRPGAAPAIPPFALLRDDDIPGCLLERRLSAAGFRFSADTLDATIDADSAIVIEGGALPRNPEERSKALHAFASPRIIVIGQGDLADETGDDTIKVIHAPGPDWTPLIDALTCGAETRVVAPDDAEPIQILAVEDNKTNQLVLRKLLDSVDCALTLVSSGAAGIEKVKDAPPDLIFMDISMPGMDGKTATGILRGWEAETGHPHIPIVALTAHATKDDRREILAAGLDDVLTKPLNRDELVAKISEVQDALRRNAGASGSDKSGAKT